MGRHSAQPEPSEPRHPIAPITDPHLFDRPLPATASVPAPPRSTPQRVQPVQPVENHSAPGNGRTPPPPFEPLPVRSAPATEVIDVVPEVGSPSLLGKGEAGRRTPRASRQRYARTGQITIAPLQPLDEDDDRSSRPRARRQLALAVAALAVVAALSGLAAILPSRDAEAQTTQINPLTTAVRTSAAADDQTSVGTRVCLCPPDMRGQAA